MIRTGNEVAAVVASEPTRITMTDDQPTHITACRKCGGKNFSVLESSVYKAIVSNAGVLRVLDITDSETDSVSCWDCLESHSVSDFDDISHEG